MREDDVEIGIMAAFRSGRETARIATMDSASTSSLEKTMSEEKDRMSITSTDSLVRYETTDVELAGRQPVVANMEEIALKALHVDDDPLLNPWSFRMFFLGRYLCGSHISVSCANQRPRFCTIWLRFCPSNDILV